MKLTGVKQLECCCDPIRIINAIYTLYTTAADNGLSKTTRVMAMTNTANGNDDESQTARLLDGFGAVRTERGQFSGFRIQPF